MFQWLGPRDNNWITPVSHKKFSVLLQSPIQGRIFPKNSTNRIELTLGENQAKHNEGVI